jgi:hypothetical protein
MKPLAFAAAVGMVALTSSTTGSAQVPGRGFSALLCVAERLGSGPQGGQVAVIIADDTGSTAQVTIIHGASSSTHLVAYQDANLTGQLDCGDIIGSVI